jgi:hypothetical protein
MKHGMIKLLSAGPFKNRNYISVMKPMTTTVSRGITSRQKLLKDE